MPLNCLPYFATITALIGEECTEVLWCCVGRNASNEDLFCLCDRLHQTPSSTPAKNIKRNYSFISCYNNNQCQTQTKGCWLSRGITTVRSGGQPWGVWERKCLAHSVTVDVNPTLLRPLKQTRRLARRPLWRKCGERKTWAACAGSHSFKINWYRLHIEHVKVCSQRAGKVVPIQVANLAPFHAMSFAVGMEGACSANYFRLLGSRELHLLGTLCVCLVHVATLTHITLDNN